MDLLDALLLAAAALAAGAMNAVAGGGTFFTFSALVATGMPAIMANATSSAAVWPGSLAGLAAYRSETKAHWRRFLGLGAVSLAGGGLGAWVLIETEDATFRALVPWLLIGATILFAASPRIKQWGRSLGSGAGRGAQAAGLAFQFLVAVYGGFFGAGMGILMLAALSLTERGDFHVANAAKTLMAALINAVAVGLFVWGGLVSAPEALLMAAAAIVGGYAGVGAARKVPEPVLRGVVVAVGLALSAYFFVRG